MDLATNRALSGFALSATLIVTLVTTIGLAGCGKDYPNCDDDNDCHQGEFCVNNVCQQCRGDQDCGPGKRCEAGACNAIPGYCNSAADCAEGQTCENNQCVAASSAAAPPPPPSAEPGQCTLDPVYFDYDSANLDQPSRDKLTAAAACMKTRSIKSVHLTGLTDPRGTEEYNLALGDRRAQAAKKYLEGLGMGTSMSASSMGEELATGSDESSWARDRRVDFQEK
jgi:peptidoglycan-associated lipoprotein